MPTPQPPTSPTAPLADTPRRRAILKQLRSRPSVKGSVIALVVLLLVVLLAPFGAPQNPYDLAALDLLDGRLPPGSQSMGGLTYWLGTDSQGRDMFSAILYGLRSSLTVGLAAVALATVIGWARSRTPAGADDGLAWRVHRYAAAGGATVVCHGTAHELVISLVLARCQTFEATYGKSCRIQPAYRPPSIDARVTPRPRS